MSMPLCLLCLCKKHELWISPARLHSVRLVPVGDEVLCLNQGAGLWNEQTLK